MRIAVVIYGGHEVTAPFPLTFMSTRGTLSPENSSIKDLILYSQHVDTKRVGFSLTFQS